MEVEKAGVTVQLSSWVRGGAATAAALGATPLTPARPAAAPVAAALAVGAEYSSEGSLLAQHHAALSSKQVMLGLSPQTAQLALRGRSCTVRKRVSEPSKASSLHRW